MHAAHARLNIASEYIKGGAGGKLGIEFTAEQVATPYGNNPVWASLEVAPITKSKDDESANQSTWKLEVGQRQASKPISFVPLFSEPYNVIVNRAKGGKEHFLKIVLATQSSEKMLADGESVRDAARKQYRCYIDHFHLARSSKEQQNVHDAAFLSRSIAEYLGEEESLTRKALLDNGRFSAREQAAQYVAWDDDLPFDLGNPVDGKSLEQALDSWFRGDRWNEFARRNQHRSDLDNLREIYQIGLRLGVLAFLWYQVPATETLAEGFLYADAPGRDGTSLLDTIIGDSVLRSASAGNLVIRLDRLTGGTERALVAELESMPCGRTYNFADVLLTGDLSAEVAALADETTALEAARKIVAVFKSALRLDFQESRNYARFNSDDPNQTSLVQITFARFGQDAHATKACQALRTLARWLGDQQTLELLPAHLQRIVAQYTSPPLPGALRDIEPPPQPLKDRLADALLPPSSLFRPEQLRPRLRRNVDEAIDGCWSQPLLANSPMLSIDDEPFDQDIHPRRFERTAFLAGHHVMVTTIIAAARDILRTTRDCFLDWLIRLEKRTSYPALVEQALLASAEQPSTMALRRKALAGHAFQEFQRELPSMLEKLNQALQPGNGCGNSPAPGNAHQTIPLPRKETARV